MRRSILYWTPADKAARDFLKAAMAQKASFYFAVPDFKLGDNTVLQPIGGVIAIKKRWTPPKGLKHANMVPAAQKANQTLRSVQKKKKGAA